MGNVRLLVGDNFTGKTGRLNEIRNAPDPDPTAKRLLIGEVPRDHLSGIFPTVKDELTGHTRRRYAPVSIAVSDLLDRIGYSHLLERNPYELSGGEQAMLAVVSHWLMEPSHLCLDTVLEQLSLNWKVEVLRLLSATDRRVHIADNRFREFAELGLPLEAVKREPVAYELPFASPDFSATLSPPSFPATVQLDRIAFSYARTKVFDRVSLQLEAGRIYHLQGRNGAGKSTLAKLLCGVLKPDQGSITVNGRRVRPYRTPGSLFGYSFQNPDDQLFYSSVGNQLGLAVAKDNDQRGRVDQIMRIFGLNGLERMHPADLPFTMRKRLALASTFAVPRQWYIVDEPTLGQDDRFMQGFATLLTSLTSVGYGIIVISHAPSFTTLLDCVPFDLVNLSANGRQG